jgi:hypothetical protein
MWILFSPVDLPTGVDYDALGKLGNKGIRLRRTVHLETLAVRRRTSRRFSNCLYF